MAEEGGSRFADYNGKLSVPVSLLEEGLDRLGVAYCQDDFAGILERVCTVKNLRRVDMLLCSSSDLFMRRLKLANYLVDSLYQHWLEFTALTHKLVALL